MKVEIILTCLLAKYPFNDNYKWDLKTLYKAIGKLDISIGVQDVTHSNSGLYRMKEGQVSYLFVQPKNKINIQHYHPDSFNTDMWQSMLRQALTKLN